MAARFINIDRETPMLLPPDLRDWVEADDLLLEDFLTTPYCLAIEWPEKIASWVPASALHLDLGITPAEKHTITLHK